MSSHPVIAIVQIAFLLAFWCWVFIAVVFLRNTVLPRMNVPDNLPPSRYQPVRFTSTDGLWLSGWILRTQESAPWIILCHGLGTNRADLLEIANGLHGAGYQILMFDFRAHGQSEGRATSFGWLERHDLEGALTFLGSHETNHDQLYGLYGISMGGSVALMVAAADERIGAVAVESPYHNLEESLGHHLTLLYRLPRWPFLPFIATVYRLRFGVWPRQMSPIDVIDRISPRPVLIIHGEEDARMPLTTIQALADRARPPKELWIVRGATHLGGLQVDAGEYLSRLVHFFDQALKFRP